MRSNALRSTTRSLTTGNAFARHGSIVIVSPSLKCRRCNWQAVVAFWPPCGMPLMTRAHVPQMPSRQSESKAIVSSPRAMSRSEERRVGKEGREGGGGDDEEKKETDGDEGVEVRGVDVCVGRGGTE